MPNNAATKVDVNVSNVQPVMIVKDMGSDADWQAKAAKQQRELAAGMIAPRTLEAPQAAQIAPGEPPTLSATIEASPVPASAPLVPVAPSWAPPVWRGNG